MAAKKKPPVNQGKNWFPRYIKVEVTSTDIRSASGRSDPVSKAIRRLGYAVPKIVIREWSEEANLEFGHVVLRRKGVEAEYWMSRRLGRLARQWKRGEKVKPLRAQLEIVDPSFQSV